MQFLYPSFLWALLALAIPVLIHLFYFKRFKKVYFTNVKYLKEIKEETSNRNRLKNLLVLASRCLAVIGLVLAFAQPFIPTGETIKTGVNAVSVFVDNSNSMTAKKQDIPLLDYAKERARSIINAYNEEDKFQVLTHDFEGRHQRLLSKEDALTYIDEINISPAVQPLDRVINRQKQLLENESGNKISYLISDFQKSITNLSSYQDTLMEVNLLPIQAMQEKNISIDSVWFDGPIPVLNQNNKLVIKVKNNSTEDAEQVKLSFKKDGQEKPIGIRDIPANTSITDTVVVNVGKAGWQQGIVSVTDYPVQFDDEYFITFSVPDTIHALFINESGANKYMDALFKGIGYFHLSNQSINQLQYQQFSKYDLIILNDLKSLTSGLSSELIQYLKNGGKVLVFPSKNADIVTYNYFLSTANANTYGAITNTKKEVAAINTDEFVFSDVYQNTRNNLKLPITTFSYDFQAANARLEEKLLTYRDGSAYLSKYRVSDGQLFVCASPLDLASNDLVINAEIFVPLVFKMAISTLKQSKLAHTITNNVVIEAENKRKTGDFVYKIVGTEEFIPGQSPNGNKINLDLNNQIKLAGFYDLMLDEEIVGQYAFNYDRKESDLSMFNESELEAINPQNPTLKIISSTLQANISSAINEKDKGIVLWKWFIIGALLFLLIETLLLRYFKK